MAWGDSPHSAHLTLLHPVSCLMSPASATPQELAAEPSHFGTRRWTRKGPRDRGPQPPTSICASGLRLKCQLIDHTALEQSRVPFMCLP
ncbi:hypothetical protein F4780DRAFT_564793 [Xylariomycetidae sp. FL0641]|nr:hypothetical protein F4780DRAFT_564793 [Xylariomycetidae sp. FL0641]